MVSRGWVTAALATAALFAEAPHAGACSCVPPSPHMVGIVQLASDVPRNAKVRAVVPRGDAVRLRERAGADIEVTVRRSGLGVFDVVVVKARGPLAYRTLHEVYVPSSPGAAPQAHVIGAFTTGDGTDDVAPTLDAVKPPRVFADDRAASSLCGTRATSVVVDASARDAQAIDGVLTLVGIWAEKDGKLSTDRPPDAFGSGAVTLGRSSLCDPTSFSFPPRGGPFTFLVAAFDAAGNTSPPRKLTVVLPARSAR